MEFLIRQAEIIHPSSIFHKTKKDILIVNGIIKSISDLIDFEGTVLSSPNLKVSLGWMDTRANYCDPGMEHKEDLESGANLAMSSGFTDVAILPNTNPVISNKNALSYFKRFNNISLVHFIRLPL